MLHLKNEIKPYNITSASDMIKESMKSNHISCKKLASLTDVDVKRIKAILNRDSWLDAKSAKKIGSALHLSSRLLLNLDKSFRSHN